MGQSQSSPHQGMAQGVYSPSPVLIARTDVHSQVLLSFVFADKRSSGNRRAPTSDRVMESRPRANMHTDDKRAPENVSGTWALLAISPLCWRFPHLQASPPLS